LILQLRTSANKNKKKKKKKKKKKCEIYRSKKNALVWLPLLYSSVNNPQNQCEEATKKRIEEKELQLQRVRPFQG